MNAAMEMLRTRAQQLYDAIAGESNIELQIDPVEEPAKFDRCNALVEPNAFILKSTVHTKELSDCLMRGANFPINPCLAHVNWLFAQQAKEVRVWIYNISHHGYTLGNGVIKNLAVPACLEDEEYSVVTSVPAVYIYPKENVDSNEIDYVLFDGRRIAMDLINPSNLGLDQDRDTRSVAWTSAVGNNYSTRGIFFSTHNPPLKKELKAAHKRLKSYYMDMMERANVVRLTAVAPSLGVTTHELKAAQQYVQDSLGNK